MTWRDFCDLTDDVLSTNDLSPQLGLMKLALEQLLTGQAVRHADSNNGNIIISLPFSSRMEQELDPGQFSILLSETYYLPLFHLILDKRPSRTIYLFHLCSAFPVSLMSKNLLKFSSNVRQ
jgi:hypothetical protein